MIHKEIAEYALKRLGPKWEWKDGSGVSGGSGCDWSTIGRGSIRIFIDDTTLCLFLEAP